MTRPKSRPDSPAARLLAVLSAVARMQTVSVSVLAEALGMPIATTHRALSELNRLGYLQRVPGTRSWTVAHHLIGLAANALTAAAGGMTANAILRALTGLIGEMSSFAVQSGGEVLYVASVESPHELTLSFRAGRRAPLFCTSSGRLFLARLPDDALIAYLDAIPRRAFTRYTATGTDELLAIVRRVRRQGYAMTHQEYVLHVVGAAVPVIGDDETFFGALSIAAPDVRTGTARMRAFLPAMRDAAIRLAKAFTRTLSDNAPGRGDLRSRSTRPAPVRGRRAARPSTPIGRM